MYWEIDRDHKPYYSWFWRSLSTIVFIFSGIRTLNACFGNVSIEGLSQRCILTE